ncbi:MAG: hypothetical protein HY996_04735 [Micrococcales bacterium]|nr:hypothetical protein [Micrococcales bacterium]
MIIVVRTPPAAPASPAADPISRIASAPRRDRIRRLVAWTTTALALSASIAGATLMLWTVIQ